MEALFFATLAYGTAAERAAYLGSACGGDAELRRQVERLLNAQPTVGDFLNKPAVERRIPFRAPRLERTQGNDQ